MGLIEIKDLSFKYAGSSFWSLWKVNLRIEKGDFVVLTGPSGCGKTTLIRCMNGLIPNYYQGEYEGRVIVDGKDASKNPVYEMAKVAGIVFQNPEDQIVSMTVEKEVAFGLENFGYERNLMKSIVNEMLSLMGIENLRYKPPFFLSGGEQQKTIIASVLALKPKILLLDEPLSSLDSISAERLVLSLSELNKKHGITIVISEHRLDLLSKFANRIVVMDKGRILIDEEIKNVLGIVDLESLGVNEPFFAKFIRIYNSKTGKRIDPCLSLEDLILKFKDEANNRV